MPANKIEHFIQSKAIKSWMNELDEINSVKIPENLILLLTSSSKKEQIKLLKDITITPDQLIAFILKAGRDFGYSLSQYSSEHMHNRLNKDDMPKLVHLKDDNVYKVGKTSLTDGQLKQAIEHRKVTVSKFLDNNKNWHCLFLTFDSIRGKEAWKSGQPHYHYISDKFGIPREEVVMQLKSKKYKLGNLPHIDLLHYRDEDE